MKEPTARVLSTSSRPKSKWRPVALDTVVCTFCNVIPHVNVKLLKVSRLVLLTPEVPRNSSCRLC